MTRTQAINALALLLSGAPNHADYVAWLNQRTNGELADLAHDPVIADPVGVPVT